MALAVRYRVEPLILPGNFARFVHDLARGWWRWREAAVALTQCSALKLLSPNPSPHQEGFRGVGQELGVGVGLERALGVIGGKRGARG